MRVPSLIGCRIFVSSGADVIYYPYICRFRNYYSLRFRRAAIFLTSPYFKINAVRWKSQSGPSLFALRSSLFALGSSLLALRSWLLALGSSLLALSSWLLALRSFLFVLRSSLFALGSWLFALGSWLLAHGSSHFALRSWLFALRS